MLLLAVVFITVTAGWSFQKAEVLEVSVSTDDSVYVLSSDNGQIYKKKEEEWSLVPSDGAKRLAVDGNNTLWIVDGKGDV